MEAFKLRGAGKLARIPVRVEPTLQLPRKPGWIRGPAPLTPAVIELKRVLRSEGLHTVCEEANCPNLGDCFAGGTATFMIMGDICTRRCPFCDVGHGRPKPLDGEEPYRLARTVKAMQLKYVVVTSVDRDDLRDGGASHFVACLKAIRAACEGIRIEILTPDFRGRAAAALASLTEVPPDVFNHNIETVPRLYRAVRPGADYKHSLELLRDARSLKADMPTKSGLMLGLSETIDEVVDVMQDLRAHGVQMLTLGQYLQPSRHHLPVARFVPPAEFEQLRGLALELGFGAVLSAPMVRSSLGAQFMRDAIQAPRV